MRLSQWKSWCEQHPAVTIKFCKALGITFSDIRICLFAVLADRVPVLLHVWRHSFRSPIIDRNGSKIGQAIDSISKKASRLAEARWLLSSSLLFAVSGDSRLMYCGSMVSTTTCQPPLCLPVYRHKSTGMVDPPVEDGMVPAADLHRSIALPHNRTKR